MVEEVEHPIPTVQNIASDRTSHDGTVWNKQENEQKARKWCLQTSAPGRMSSIALPAVILGEGKSLIPKPGQTGLLSHGKQPV